MRSLTATLILAATLLLPATLACGENGDDSRPASTATPAPERSTPDASATPEPSATSTPIPSPTPAELTFIVPDGADGTNSPRSSGPLGIVYAEAQFGHDAAANRIQAGALVRVGVNERPSASAWLWNDFLAPGEGSSVTAQISTDVSWKGVLAGNGAAGTGAGVTITLSVLEGGTTRASEVVHTREQRETALTLGGLDDIGSETVELEVTLVPGRLYELRLTVSCGASSGLIGAATYCLFSASDLYETGYVQWGTRSILFLP